MVKVRKHSCSQYDLAEALGLSQQEISRYESGITKAPVSYIRDLAEYCEVSTDYILGLSIRKSELLSDESVRLQNIFDALTPENKAKLLERAETMLEMQK